MSVCGEHALVIGASISGLMAARVLSERFARVTLLERDALGDVAEPRRGAPQARHPHGLLASGARALDELFPGFEGDVVAAGGRRCDVVTDCLWHNFGGVLRTAPSDLKGFLLSRPALELLVRRRVRALANVSLVDCRDVVALACEGGRVVGVAHKRAGVNEPRQNLRADLVVDASGRGGRSLYWLDEMNFPLPAEDRVEVDLSYTTRIFRRRPGDLPGRQVAFVGPNPANWRLGVLMFMEDDRWMVTLAGYFSDRAPTDLQGFRAYARSLATPAIHEIIADAEPLGDASVHNFRASQRRRFERLKKFPEGYLVIGDGLASVNPIYGQGMSAVAAEALALRACLAEGADNLWRRFFAAAAKAIDTPWSIAVGGDLAHPKVEGSRSVSVRLLNWYVEKLYRAGHSDPAATQAFLEVVNLVAPPSALLRPAVVARVARAHLWPGARVAPAAALPA